MVYGIQLMDGVCGAHTIIFLFASSVLASLQIEPSHTTIVLLCAPISVHPFTMSNNANCIMQGLATFETIMPFSRYCIKGGAGSEKGKGEGKLPRANKGCADGLDF